MSDEQDPGVTVSVLKSELTILRSEMTDLEKRLAKRIAEDGAATRAHMDIMFKKMDGTFRFVAELAARYGIVPDNQESRLQKIKER
jgi:hypothetical protein